MSDGPYILRETTVIFSKNVVEFCKNEKLTVINRPIIDQLIRSATSIGANYAEADNAGSRSDFRNKIFIAKKEAAETKYWLNLILDVAENPETCKQLQTECHHILMTLQKVTNTLANRSQPAAQRTVHR
jgi:four helix bundle protein